MDASLESLLNFVEAGPAAIADANASSGVKRPRDETAGDHVNQPDFKRTNAGAADGDATANLEAFLGLQPWDQDGGGLQVKSSSSSAKGADSPNHNGTTGGPSLAATASSPNTALEQIFASLKHVNSIASSTFIGSSTHPSSSNSSADNSSSEQDDPVAAFLQTLNETHRVANPGSAGSSSSSSPQNNLNPQLLLGAPGAAVTPAPFGVAPGPPAPASRVIDRPEAPPPRGALPFRPQDLEQLFKLFVQRRMAQCGGKTGFKSMMGVGGGNGKQTMGPKLKQDFIQFMHTLKGKAASKGLLGGGVGGGTFAGGIAGLLELLRVADGGGGKGGPGPSGKNLPGPPLPHRGGHHLTAPGPLHKFFIPPSVTEKENALREKERLADQKLREVDALLAEVKARSANLAAKEQETAGAASSSGSSSCVGALSTSGEPPKTRADFATNEEFEAYQAATSATKDTNGYTTKDWDSWWSWVSESGAAGAAAAANGSAAAAMFSAAGTSKGPPSACASSATPYGVAPFGKGGFVSTSGFVAGKYTGGGPFQKGKFTTKHGAHLLSSVGVGKQVLNPAAGPLGGGPGTNYHMGAVKGAAPPYGAAGFVPAGSTATTSNPYAGYGNGQQLQVQYPQQHQGGGQGKPKGQAPGYGQLIIHSGGGKGGVGAGASQQIHNGGGAAPAAASSSAGPTPTTAALPNNDTTLTRTSGVTSPGGQNGSETGRSPAADANANANASQNNNVTSSGTTSGASSSSCSTQGASGSASAAGTSGPSASSASINGNASGAAPASGAAATTSASINGNSSSGTSSGSSGANGNSQHQTTTPTGTPKGFLTGRGYQAFNPQPVGGHAHPQAAQQQHQQPHQQLPHHPRGGIGQHHAPGGSAPSFVPAAAVAPPPNNGGPGPGPHHMSHTSHTMMMRRIGSTASHQQPPPPPPPPPPALHPIQMNGHPMQMKGVGVGVGIPMAGGGMIPPGAIPIGAPPGMLAAGGKGGTTFVPIRPPGPGGGMVPPGGVGGMIGAGPPGSSSVGGATMMGVGGGPGGANANGSAAVVPPTVGAPTPGPQNSFPPGQDPFPDQTRAVVHQVLVVPGGPAPGAIIHQAPGGAILQPGPAGVVGGAPPPGTIVQQVGGGAPGSNGNPGSPDEETKRKEEEKKFHEILVG